MAKKASENVEVIPQKTEAEIRQDISKLSIKELVQELLVQVEEKSTGCKYHRAALRYLKQAEGLIASGIIQV